MYFVKNIKLAEFEPCRWKNYNPTETDTSTLSPVWYAKVEAVISNNHHSKPVFCCTLVIKFFRDFYLVVYIDIRHISISVIDLTKLDIWQIHTTTNPRIVVCNRKKRFQSSIKEFDLGFYVPRVGGKIS